MSAPHRKRLARKPRPFQGDVDLIELRRRLSIEANVIPEPPFGLQQQSALRSPWFAKFALSVGVLSIMFWGVLEGAHLKGAYQVYPGPNNAIASITTPSNAIPPASTTKPATTDSGARPTTPILVGVHDQRALMNEPLALGAVLYGAEQEAIHIGGLNEGSRLSAGEKLGPTRWRVPARDVAGVLVLPPVSFVGVMNAVIQVWSPGNVPLDTQYARFEWVATTAAGATPAKALPEREDQSSPPTTRLDPERIAWLVRRGADFMRMGDFAAARLVLRPAADAGDPQAALMLGATFDPVIVADLGVIGLSPDPGVARAWYQRAMASGSLEASRRIEQLARMSQ
jgi:hypothetical protein